MRHLISWRTFQIFFIFSVRGQGEGRRRPSRWQGSVFHWNRGRGGYPRRQGGCTRAARMSAERRGELFFFRGRNSHRLIFSEAQNGSFGVGSKELMLKEFMCFCCSLLIELWLACSVQVRRQLDLAMLHLKDFMPGACTSQAALAQSSLIQDRFPPPQSLSLGRAPKFIGAWKQTPSNTKLLLMKNDFEMIFCNLLLWISRVIPWEGLSFPREPKVQNPSEMTTNSSHPVLSHDPCGLRPLRGEKKPESPH